MRRNQPPGDWLIRWDWLIVVLFFTALGVFAAWMQGR